MKAAWKSPGKRLPAPREGSGFGVQVQATVRLIELACIRIQHSVSSTSTRYSVLNT